MENQTTVKFCYLNVCNFTVTVDKIKYYSNGVLLTSLDDEMGSCSGGGGKSVAREFNFLLAEL